MVHVVELSGRKVHAPRIIAAKVAVPRVSHLADNFIPPAVLPPEHTADGTARPEKVSSKCLANHRLPRGPVVILLRPGAPGQERNARRLEEARTYRVPCH